MRVGVDVGGTFTKAVACRPDTGRVQVKAVVPTTHGSPNGVIDGVVEALGQVTEQARSKNLGPVNLVGHSTTQAVNALLEGDTALVGVLGIGRRPDVRRSRRRTVVGDVGLAPGRSLRTVHEFVDASSGLERATVVEAVERLRERGAQALCASEAFGVDDPQGERLTLSVAEELGIPACAGHELSGLYGLEMRTVTAAINAGILPASLSTAEVVEAAVKKASAGAPLLVMRGDGGASDLRSTRTRPLVTAFSGPAASVAGALRHLPMLDGVVVEVGGTSTNVSVVRGGRPVLSYVRVLEHVTSVRSLDVRVVGVAGGSMLRVKRRLGRPRLDDVGPRSAHIAGLRYACFARPDELHGVEAELVAPRPRDPGDYVALRTPSGRRFALTLTCAANAVGNVGEGMYARGDRTSARLGFAALARVLGTTVDELAREVVELAARRIGTAAAEAVGEVGLVEPVVVGVGGGAAAIVPAVAERLGCRWSIPDEAEVISSVGDALSMVRVELESSFSEKNGRAVAELQRRAETAALEAGAAPASVQVETEAIPERRALRAVALGAVALGAEMLPGAAALDEESLRLVAKRELHDDVELVLSTGPYRVFTTTEGGRFAVVDERGTVALSGAAEVLSGTAEDVSVRLAERIPALVRRFGPVAVGPAVRVLRGAKLADLSLLSDPDAVLSAARTECSLADGSLVAAFLSRS